MSVTISPTEITTVTESSQSLRSRLSLNLLPLMEQATRKRKLFFAPPSPISGAIPNFLGRVKRFRRTSAIHTLANHEPELNMQTNHTPKTESDAGIKKVISTRDLTSNESRTIKCDELVRMLDTDNTSSSTSQPLILDIRSLATQAKFRIRGAVGIPCESRVKLRRTLPILDKYLHDRNPLHSLDKQLVIICPEDDLDEIPAIKDLLECMINHIRMVHSLDVRVLKGGFHEFKLSYPQFCECPSDILHKIQIQVKQNMTRKHQVQSNTSDEAEPDAKSADSFSPLPSPISHNPLLLPGLGISPDFHSAPLSTLKKSFLRLKNEFIPDSAHSSPYPSTPLPRPTEDLDSPKNVFHAQASQILPFLYLGNESDSVNETIFNTNGIQSVLNVTLKTPFLDETRYRCCRLAVSDLPSQDLRPYFTLAFQFIEEARHSGYAVLVHCQAGVSRSPAFVIAYLMAYSNLSLLQAYQLVKSKRSVISPNFAFMGQLCEFESDLLAGRAIRNPDVLNPVLAQDPNYLKQLDEFPPTDLDNSTTLSDPDRRRTFWNHFFSQETVVS